MSEPVLVEILAYAPTAFYHCTHCEVAWREMGVTNRIHQEQVNNSLPPDLAQDYQALSDWVRFLFNRYCDQVIVKVIDVASIEGFVKSIRYGVRRYPAIIVNRQNRFSGSGLQAAETEISRLIGEPESI